MWCLSWHAAIDRAEMLHWCISGMQRAACTVYLLLHPHTLHCGVCNKARLHVVVGVYLQR